MRWFGRAVRHFVGWREAGYFFGVTCSVGGAGKTLYVYDATTDELRGKLEGTSDVRSVAVFEVEGAGRIVAGYEDGTIKVWDSGAFWASNCRSLAKTDRSSPPLQPHSS